MALVLASLASLLLCAALKALGLAVVSGRVALVLACSVLFLTTAGVSREG
jgi:hypothetical protein